MSNKQHSIQDLLLIANTMIEVSDTPHLDCQLLLANCLNQSREWLLAHHDEGVYERHRDKFLALVSRRKKGEPVAYLLGYRDFWDSRLKVTRDTLIPRPETELIIETILNNFDHRERLVVDLGTGSGAIAITLAKERPEWIIIGVDLSYDALCVARMNGQLLPNLHWFQGDWGDAFSSCSIDLLVCNPPYIAENDPHLHSLSYEPQEALISDDNGMQDLAQVINCARSVLKNDGHLIVEHGHEQQSDVCDLLQASDFDQTPLIDLNGNPRAVWSKRIPES
jgi:release factor glutamine methyltransferase